MHAAAGGGSLLFVFVVESVAAKPTGDAGVACTATSLNLTQHSDSKTIRVDGCERLELAFSHLGVEGASALSHALARQEAALARITHVNVSWAALGTQGAMELLPTLQRASRLRSIDVTGNWIGDESLHGLARLLHYASELRVLRLRWNRLSATGMQTLCDDLRRHRRIEEFDLGGNWLGAAGAQQLASCLPGERSLRHLRLDSNNLATAGLGHLMAALRNNSALKTLDLADNNITDYGVSKLSKLLSRKATHLRSLSLRANERVTDQSAADLSRALVANKKLATLDLSGNRLTESGASALASALTGSSALYELNLHDNCRTRTYGRAKREINASILKPLEQMLAARTPSWKRRPASRLRPDPSDYWRQVYPLASEQTLAALAQDPSGVFLFSRAAAPRAMMRRPCEQHSWALCSLEHQFRPGLSPPKIQRDTFFAPFRAPPGWCMRSLFSWAATAGAWEASYPHAAGMPDHTWSEVVHTRDSSGGAWLYLATGSGLFWNCGRSLRARNKAAAAIRLVEESAAYLPREKRKGSAAETLAHLITINDRAACGTGDHCIKFMQALRSNRKDRNDNCYGRCSLSEAPLHVWLHRTASDGGARHWDWDQMSASSVFDALLWRWAKRLKYDSLQLTLQPQVWCGLGWTTEMVDLRVRLHRTVELRQYLQVRDPLASSTAPGAPCVVRGDNASRRTFSLSLYCEGTLMERTARCLADAAGPEGKKARLFTVYSRYSRARFEACVQNM